MLLWLYSYLLEAPFDSFLFFESPSFESINRDYYQIVYRPTTHEEIKAAYYAKMSNLTKAFAIIMTHSKQAAQVISQRLEA